MRTQRSCDKLVVLRLGNREESSRMARTRRLDAKGSGNEGTLADVA